MYSVRKKPESSLVVFGGKYVLFAILSSFLDRLPVIKAFMVC